MHREVIIQWTFYAKTGSHGCASTIQIFNKYERVVSPSRSLKMSGGKIVKAENGGMTVKKRIGVHTSCSLKEHERKYVNNLFIYADWAS